jgi:inosose dehydratase
MPQERSMTRNDVRIAASPTNWHNDDFPILGSTTSIDEILCGMQEAGFAGTELGSLYPRTAGELLPILDQYGLELAAGWFSAYLLTRDFTSECKRFEAFVEFLEQSGATVCTTAECSYCPFRPYPPRRYAQQYEALAVALFPYQLQPLADDQWSALGEKFDVLTSIAADHNIRLGYHPHMQTVVQTAEHIAALADATTLLDFTIDPGHLRFAGADPVELLDLYIDRTVHVHVTNVRDRVIEAATTAPMSYELAVVGGAFTVPGDGGIDYGRIFDILKEHDYNGWLVVEAEQHPLTADPALYAKLGREYIRGMTGW